MPKTISAAMKLRLRVVLDEDDAFGPGKAQILESLMETRSLNRTATAMKMSYVKALALVKAMNSHFAEPLVTLTRGGRQGGGTEVTATGQKVLSEYHAARAAAEAAVEPAWRNLRRLLRKED